MSDNLLATLISALAVVSAAAVTIYLSRAKDREAVWRATKLKYYEEFLASLSATVSVASSVEDKRRWAQACNTLHLIASVEVIKALRLFQDATGSRSSGLSDERHDELLSRLIWQIRTDLGIKPGADAPDFLVRMWSAPAK